MTTSFIVLYIFAFLLFLGYSHLYITDTYKVHGYFSKHTKEFFLYLILTIVILAYKTVLLLNF